MLFYRSFATYFWLFSLFCLCNSYKFITKSQWKTLHLLIKSPETTSTMREKINLILFHRHLPLVHRMVRDFRKFHKYKSLNIHVADMNTYAYKALSDATRKYDGNHNFAKYAKIYINGGLYKSLTVHNPITSVPKKIRAKHVENLNDDRFQTRENIYLNTRDFVQSDNTRDDADYIHFPNYDDYRKMWSKIEAFQPFAARCFRLKFDFFFNKIRSNKRIAELMCCSEELVRRSIANHIQILVSNTTRIY